MNLLRGIAAAVFFALCVALVIIGQTIRSPMGLLIMLLGLAGLLVMLGIYNRRYTRADRIAKNAEKAGGEGRREKIKPHPVMEHPAENHSRRVIWRLAQAVKESDTGRRRLMHEKFFRRHLLRSPLTDSLVHRFWIDRFLFAACFALCWNES